MPFGTIGRTGPGMRQVAGFGDPSTERGTFGENLGRAIVTNGDFTAYVCNSAATQPSSQIASGRLVVFFFFLLLLGRPTYMSEICRSRRFLKGVGYFQRRFQREGSVAHRPLLV